MRLRKRLSQILDPEHDADALSRIANVVILILILVTVICFILESDADLQSRYGGFFDLVEAITVIAFTIEYVLRVWCCVEVPRYSQPVVGRGRYMLSPMAIVDMLAVLPFYLPFLNLNFIYLRSLRAIRLFRIAKLGRYSQALNLLAKVVTAKRGELLASMMVGTVMLVVASAGMFYCENDSQPETFSSIPAAICWTASSLANLKHGDPVTSAGKLIAVMISILGMGILAMPAGIVGAGLIEQVQRRRKSTFRCPHCGKRVGGKELQISDEFPES